MAKRRVRTKDVRLTPRQAEVLRYVQGYRSSHGYSPTLQEIAAELGVSKVTVFEHVEALEASKLCRREPNKARSLRLTERAQMLLKETAAARDQMAVRGGPAVPLAGTIAAGLPVEAAEDREVLDLEDLISASEPVFALRVQGDSMIQEQIRAGDYVLVRQTDRPEIGRIVVALLDGGETTLKKLYRHGRGYRLVAANPAYEDIYTEELRIQGVVIGVVRQC